MAEIIVASLLLASAARAEAPLEAAEESYKKGDYARARELASRATGREPVKAWRLAGASACMMKDRSGALDAMTHLPAKDDREFIRFVCERAGISINEEEVALHASPARDLMFQAQVAYDSAQYAEAKKLAQAATVADRKLAKAWRLLGAASCWTHDKRTAQTASDHLQPIDQEFLRNLCARTAGGALKSNRTVR